MPTPESVNQNALNLASPLFLNNIFKLKNENIDIAPVFINHLLISHLLACIIIDPNILNVKFSFSYTKLISIDSDFHKNIQDSFCLNKKTLCNGDILSDLKINVLMLESLKEPTTSENLPLCDFFEYISRTDTPLFTNNNPYVINNGKDEFQLSTYKELLSLIKDSFQEFSATKDIIQPFHELSIEMFNNEKLLDVNFNLYAAYFNKDGIEEENFRKAAFTQKQDAFANFYQDQDLLMKHIYFEPILLNKLNMQDNKNLTKKLNKI